MRVPAYVTNAMLALLYAVVYYLCYINFLNYYFDYAGFTLHPKDPAFMALSFVLAIMPIVTYRGARGVSSVISLFVFILLYVPIVLTFALASEHSLAETFLVQATFCFCMCLLFLVDLLPIRNPLNLMTGANLFAVVLVLTLAATVYVAFVYRSNLRFVSFGEAVYEQRFANVELGSDIVTRYLSSWLGTVLVPLCLAHGLVTRRPLYVLAGSLACVVIYMATATKWLILLPFVYGGMYVLFGHGRIRLMYPLLTLSLTTLLAGLLAITKPGGIAFLVSSILMWRTVGNGGQLAMTYYDFFSTHPQTAYTHINVVGMATGAYPYGSLGIGQVIGQHYYGPDVNANASFWATDGIAALGIEGIVIATLACVLVFFVMNSLTLAYDRLFVVLCFLPFILSLLNTSLFSSLWSGGAFFLFAFFLLNDRTRASAGSLPRAKGGPPTPPLHR